MKGFTLTSIFSKHTDWSRFEMNFVRSDIAQGMAYAINEPMKRYLTT